jgi:predicted O-methyltransferase YrrM
MRLGRNTKDTLKQLYFRVYKTGAKMGVLVLPAHYYCSEPDIIELGRTVDQWATPSELPGIEVDLDAQLDHLTRVCLPFRDEYKDNRHYHTGVQEHYGPGFGYVEAQLLYAVVRYYQPPRIVEVGSGVSTYCCQQAVKTSRTADGRVSDITCIEPHPSAPLRAAAEAGEVRLIQEPVQRVPLAVFTELSAGDVLFIDSSHVVKAGSDVEHIILEILPRLRAGVLVHFHDIYLPYNYQRDLLQTFVHANETPVLRAFLTQNENFRILFCLSHLHYERPEDLKLLFPGYWPQPASNGLRPMNADQTGHFPSSIWLEVVN